MKDVKVVVVGAGSVSFGRGTIADLMSSKELNSTNLTVTLVDINEDSLNRMYKFTKLLKNHYENEATIKATTDRTEALPGADYVIIAVARDRNELWAQDFHVPNSHGFKQAYGECGGPGGSFHALRSFHLTMPIVRDMEKYCPDALLLNFTNPETRVAMVVSELSEIEVVGLCHGYISTENIVAEILEREKEEIDINIGGINHFHWVMGIKDKDTGKDLYPEFHDKMAKSDWDKGKLTRDMYETFNIMPFPSVSHLAEFVSYGFSSAGPVWFDYMRQAVFVEEEKFGVNMSSQERIDRVLSGKDELAEDLTRPSNAFLAVPIICDIEFDKNKKEISANVLNQGAISNLPNESVVEIPVKVDAEGIHPVKVGALPKPIAAMCRRQLIITDLLIEAYKKRSKNHLLQAVLLDPVVDNIKNAKKMVDELLFIEKDYLPEFK